MGVMVDWRNQILLDCSNSIFYGLYESILDVIRDQNLLLNTEISKLIKRLGLRTIKLYLAQALSIKLLKFP